MLINALYFVLILIHFHSSHSNALRKRTDKYSWAETSKQNTTQKYQSISIATWKMHHRHRSKRFNKYQIKPNLVALSTIRRDFKWFSLHHVKNARSVFLSIVVRSLNTFHLILYQITSAKRKWLNFQVNLLLLFFFLHYIFPFVFSCIGCADDDCCCCYFPFASIQTIVTVHQFGMMWAFNAPNWTDFCCTCDRNLQEQDPSKCVCYSNETFTKYTSASAFFFFHKLHEIQFGAREKQSKLSWSAVLNALIDSATAVARMIQHWRWWWWRSSSS